MEVYVVGSMLIYGALIWCRWMGEPHTDSALVCLVRGFQGWRLLLKSQCEKEVCVHQVCGL